jgi:IS30 family transposase
MLRQYFPKGADVSAYGPEDLEHVAQELNGRHANARLSYPSRAPA